LDSILKAYFFTLLFFHLLPFKLIPLSEFFDQEAYWSFDQNISHHGENRAEIEISHVHEIGIIPLQPKTMLRVENMELHEHTIAQKDTIGQPSLRDKKPVLH